MSIGNSKSKAEQLQALKIGRGIQHLLNEAYRILGNPMLVHDMEYKLIACTQNIETDDPIWNEYEQHGTPSAQTIDFFKTEGFIDDVANSTLQNGVTYLLSDKLKYDRIFGQLYNKDHVAIADMVIIACKSPFDDDTPELTRILCNVLSKELSKNAYYHDYGQVYTENVIQELLVGSISDNRIYTGHVANIDKNLKKNIYVSVADIASCDAEYSKLGYYRDLFKKTQPDFEYCLYHNYIVILMSWDAETWLDGEKDVKKLRRLFEYENIYAGISSRFENLFELRKYYAEAVEALNYGFNADGAKRIHLYDEIKHEFQK